MSRQAIGRGQHHVDEPDRPRRVGRPGGGEQRLEVGHRLLGVGLGLVGEAPEHHGGVVPVAGDQLLDGLPVHGLGGRSDRLLGERRAGDIAEDPAAHAEVQAHGGGLVDDHDPEPVGEVEDLLGVGVVRGPERVRAQPGQELEVVHHRRVVVPRAPDVQVLVHAEALEVERLAVDQEPGAVHLHGPDADGLVVAVDQRLPVEDVDLEVVEVAVARSPAMDLGDPELASGALPLGHRRAVGVAEHDPDRTVALDGRRPRHDARGSVEFGHHGHVSQVCCRRRAEPDAADEAGVVVEVLEVELLALPPTEVVDDPRRDGCPVQLVVDHDRHPQGLPGDGDRRQVGLEGRVAPLVLTDLLVPGPHDGAVGGGVEPEDDAASVPAPGDVDDPLVPDVARRGRAARARPRRRRTPTGPASAATLPAGPATTPRSGPHHPGRRRSPTGRRGAWPPDTRCPAIAARSSVRPPDPKLRESVTQGVTN